jgi:hypothetical protein
MGFNGRRPPGGCRGGRLPSFKTLVVPTRYGAETALASTVALPQHPDQHRPERSILLAVDEEFGEGAALRIASELTDPVGALEVGEHEDLEGLGGGSRPEGIQALAEAPRLCDPGLLSSERPSLPMHTMRPGQGHGRALRLSLSLLARTPGEKSRAQRHEGLG